jgi:hypothetical protein
MAEIARAYASNPIAPDCTERFGEDAGDDRPRGARGPRWTLPARPRSSSGSARSPPRRWCVGGRHDAMFTPSCCGEAVAGPLPGARLALLDAGHEVGNRAAGPARRAGRGVPRRPRGSAGVHGDGARFARA